MVRFLGSAYLSRGLFLLSLNVASLPNVQVTYRVVQVTDQHLEGRDDGGGAVSVVSTAAFSGAPQAVAQVPKCSCFY